jgi:hypothetical protein
MTANKSQTIQVDRSGVGHCWVAADDDSMPASIRDEILAEIVDGRTVTGWPSILTDLENAGADVVDQEVAIDGNLITSRKPEDIPAFTQALIDALELDEDEEELEEDNEEDETDDHEPEETER